MFNAQRALTSSPVIFDLTSDSEDVRKPISSGTQKRSRQEAGIGETSLTVYEKTSSTSQGVVHAKGDDVVGRLRFPDKNGFIDMGQTPWRPHTNWGFRLPTKTDLPFSEIQLRQAYGTDYVGGHILLPLPMPLLIHFGNNMAEFKAAFEEYLRLLRFYRVHFGDACICIWLDDPDIPIPGFPLAPPPPPPHPHSCLARTLEAIRVEELVQPLTQTQKDDRIATAILIDNASAGEKGSSMGDSSRQAVAFSNTLKRLRQMAGNRTLKVPASIVGANGAPKHSMNIAYGLQEQAKMGVAHEPGSYYRDSVSHDSREHTKMQLSATAVQSWARAKADTGEVSHDQALEESDDQFGTRHRFSVPAVLARIAAGVAAGTFSSAAEGRRAHDALNGTTFSLSSPAVILASSALAEATNTTRSDVLIKGDQLKGSKVAQSGSGLTIQMSDDFRQSNEDKFDIFFVPNRRVSFKEGAKKLDERLTQTSNTNQALKRLIDQIETGTVNPTATSGSLTFMLLKKEAATPQMQIVSTAQKLPTTRPTDWDALITSSPMPIGYNSIVDGKQDGVKPSKAPHCEPTDLAKKEYAVFKTTLAPWYREEKKLKVDDTVYLVYTSDNMNPMVFHSKTRMESIIKLGESKNVTKTLALFEKHEISTLKGASVIVFRC